MADFNCLGYPKMDMYKTKKICVPTYCDHSYNCPYPYICEENTGKCVLDPKTDKKCQVNSGTNFKIWISKCITKWYGSEIFRHFISILVLFVLCWNILYLDCGKGCYCWLPHCTCVCDKCPAAPCPQGYTCIDSVCMKMSKCQDHHNCPPSWCCSIDHQCKPPSRIPCKSSKDCERHIERTHCQKEDDTCMADGICGANVCRHDDDCLNDHYCSQR